MACTILVREPLINSLTSLLAYNCAARGGRSYTIVHWDELSDQDLRVMLFRHNTNMSFMSVEHALIRDQSVRQRCEGINQKFPSSDTVLAPRNVD